MSAWWSLIRETVRGLEQVINWGGEKKEDLERLTCSGFEALQMISQVLSDAPQVFCFSWILGFTNILLHIRVFTLGNFSHFLLSRHLSDMICCLVVFSTLWFELTGTTHHFTSLCAAPMIQQTFHDNNSRWNCWYTDKKSFKKITRSAQVKVFSFCLLYNTRWLLPQLRQQISNFFFFLTSLWILVQSLTFPMSREQHACFTPDMNLSWNLNIGFTLHDVI